MLLLYNKKIKDTIKIKGISESYKSKYLNHQQFRKVLFDNKNLNKVEFILYQLKIKNYLPIK